MKKFPVKIDLSTFFQDERKFVIILVDPEWKSVEYLQHRVEEIFDVRPVRFLTNDGLFIPPQESVEVVAYTESLKAYIPKHAIEESHRRSKHFAIPEIKENKDFAVTEERSIKKRKYYTLGTEVLNSSTPNQKKRSRRTPVTASSTLTSTAMPSTNDSQEITSTNEQDSGVKSLGEQESKHLKNQQNAGSETASVDSDLSDNQGTTCEGMELNAITKKKRKRPGKKSCSQQTISKEKTEQCVYSMTIGRPGEVPSSTLLSTSKSMDTDSHIYFDDSTIVATANSIKASKRTKAKPIQEQTKPRIIFKCKLNEKDIGKPLIFPLKVVNKNKKSRKPLIDIKENILLPPAHIENIIKEKAKQDLNKELDNNIAAVNSLINLESEGKECLENVNSMETENTQTEFTKNEIKNNTEISNDHTNFEKLCENTTNVSPNITLRLEDSSIRDNESKDIENVTPGENNKNITNSKDEKTANANNDGVTVENSKSTKETENANITNTESSRDDCSLNITQKENSIQSKNKKLGNKKNSTDDLESSSSTIDESCVIDLDDDDDDDEEDVIDLSDADENPNEESAAMNRSKNLSGTLNKSITKMSIKEMFPFCTPLDGTPKVGDVVVFKFNRKALGDKLDVSEFIAGKCEHVNRRTKVLKLAIIDARSENNIIPHQYAYNLDESLNTDKYMNIKVSELIDPKVLET
ncbi:coilin [Eurosta solidaginis]|uniref:coilin n=1 Tax=Eurosta solidaginis TaxID=178769 RepID=UPI0035316D4B